MVTIVKHEWHSHDRQYAIELDEDILSEIYPDLKKKEIKKVLKDIESGEIDIDSVINDAWDNDVELEWEFQYDDCWTDRKGGYDVTYELGDENSWVEPEKDPEPTHKCTKCKWKGQSWEAEFLWDETDSDEPKRICPMCDSDLELTEFGVEEKAKHEQRMAELNAMLKEAEGE